MSRRARRARGGWSIPPLLVVLPALAIALAGCRADAPAAAPTATSPPAPAATTAGDPARTATAGAPTSVAPVSASATAAATSTVTATATRAPNATPSPTATPAVPAGQAVDLPDVELRYELSGTLTDFEAGHVDAIATVRITSREAAPLRHLDFRIVPGRDGLFTLQSLSRDGVPLDGAFSDGGTTLTLPLDPPLPPGGETSLHFEYALDVRDVGDGYATVTRDGPVLRLGYWYPMLSNAGGYPPLLDPPYTSSADFDVTFSVPAGVVVAASARPIEHIAGPDGNRDGYRYRLAHGRDFALMLSRDYALEERDLSGGIHVQIFAVGGLYGGDDPERQAEVREAAFAIAERALAEYAANIGPYPWTSLAIVEGGPGLGGGIEFTALTIVNLGSNDNDLLIAHEIAHMWFYAAIGTRTQADPWVDEGMATFLSRGLLYGYATSAAPDAAWPAPLDSSIADLVGFTDSQWVAVVYEQGASFYAESFSTLGAGAFWQAMHRLYDARLFRVATPWDILSILQQAAGYTDLRPLFSRHFTYDWIAEL